MYVQYNVFIVAIYNAEHIILKILLKFNPHILNLIRLLNTINFDIEHQFEYKFQFARNST